MVHDSSFPATDHTEFNNDDTDLYVRPPEVGRGIADTDDGDAGEVIEIVDDLYFSGVFEGAVDETAPSGGGDPFVTFASLLERVGYSVGGDEADAAILGALLGFTRADSTMPPESVMAALQAGDIVQRDARGMARTERFARQVRGWQGILRGESDDFSDCGAPTLDEWASDLLARLVGNVARAPAIRRELRKLGIAAFGLVATAA
jgi:hypothetical protein